MIEFHTYAGLFKELGLEPNELEALKVLIRTSNRTAAAEAGSVTRQTIINWLTNPEHPFSKAYSQIRDDLYGQAEQIPMRHQLALDTLEKMTRGEFIFGVPLDDQDEGKLVFRDEKEAALVLSAADKLARLTATGKDNRKQEMYESKLREIEEKLKTMK